LEHDDAVHGLGGVYLSGGGFVRFLRRAGGFVRVCIGTGIQALVGEANFIFGGFEGGTRGGCERGVESFCEKTEVWVRGAGVREIWGGVGWPALGRRRGFWEGCVV